jgi:glycosyltransferase involved in cell wall biosynthesis
VFLCWTLNSGTTFYRMMNFVRYSKDKLSFAMSKWNPDMDGVADWEYKIKDPQVGADLHTLIKNCDITISQKFHSHGGLALMDVFRKQYPDKPWYTELDDHIFAVNPSSIAHESYNPGSDSENIVLEQITLSKGLIVSTEYLKRVYEKINPNVWVVPNAIDFNIWDSLKEKIKKTNKIRIGWAGGGAHIADLEFIYQAIDKVRRKYSNAEFVLLGGFPDCYKDIRKIKTIRKWYPINTYPQGVKDLNMDIALAPLRDNDFNRGKSNLRWLEYSALKLPTIASNVEPFKCIRDREDGILVTEPEEWIDAMSELIEDESLRRKIGEASYRRVKKDYNAQIVSKDYVKKVKLMIAGNVNISKEALVENLT